jgi:hypothetical protein
MIKAALHRLEKYCKKQGYQGWDVFDGLNSRLLCCSPLFKSRLVRLAWIQLFKRSPLNFRRLALVSPGVNPKALSLFASGMISLSRIKDAEVHLSRLKQARSPGYKSYCWGYNFPWQAKAFYVPTGKPNAIATLFAANAFLDHYEATGNSESLGVALESCNFIVDNLTLHENHETLCFGYIPDEKARVHNVNMLAAALLGQVHKHESGETLLSKSRKAMAYSMAALDDQFFWPYGELPHHKFIDNFHTGYNLVALNAWQKDTGETAWTDKLKLAYERFLGTFWMPDGRPKYFKDRLYPIDIHCTAQGIVTCLKLEGLDRRSLSMAVKIAEWAIKNMQDKGGFFYYQKTRWFTNRIPYMRWSQAWMFYALSLLTERLAK